MTSTNLSSKQVSKKDTERPTTFMRCDHLLKNSPNKASYPLHIDIVDYQNAFDSIETWAVFETMYKARINSRYFNLVKYIWVTYMPHYTSKSISRGASNKEIQSHPISTFYLGAGNVFRGLKRNQKGMNIDGKRLNHRLIMLPSWATSWTNSHRCCKNLRMN